MSVFSLDPPVWHIVCWLCCYVLLALSHCYLERWLSSRFQNRHRPLFSLLRPKSRSILAPITPVLALATGAFVPLAPNVVIAGRSGPLHLFGGADAGVFIALALSWLNVGFLSWSRRRWQGEDAAIQRVAGLTLCQSLPTLLLVLSVFAIGSAISPYAQVGFRISELIDVQRQWNGMRWIAYLQPVALLLWISCTAPPITDPQTAALIPGCLSVLNYDLLTSALFFGGWQGPFVEQVPWLGLIYSALKVGVLAFLRTWIAASLPASQLRAYSRRIWTWCTPLSALNLFIAVTVVALR